MTRRYRLGTLMMAVAIVALIVALVQRELEVRRLRAESLAQTRVAERLARKALQDLRQQLAVTNARVQATRPEPNAPTLP